MINWTNRPGVAGWEEESKWGERTEEAFEEFVASGKGLVVYHITVGAFAHWEEWEKMSGGNWRSYPGCTGECFGHHSARHDFLVEIQDHDHPITRGLADFMVERDELYANLRFHPESNHHVLATAWDDHSLYGPNVSQPIPGPGLDQPMFWTTQYGEGRGFVTVLGHDAFNVSQTAFAVTFARGAEWAATGEVTLPVPPELAAK